MRESTLKPSRRDHAFLDAMRTRGDPRADDLVAQIVAEGGRDALRGLMRRLFEQGGGDHMLPPAVRALGGPVSSDLSELERKRLFLARDPYGIKPLYTANDGWTFRFASQVKALLAGNQVSRDPEPAGVVGFHLFGSVPEPFTFYREIRSLPAGQTQWVDSAGPREPKPFFSLAEVLAKGAVRPVSRDEVPERVRSGVLDSVRAHLLADVEVGIFLSAGIDSGALLGAMRETGQQEIRAITLAFEEFTDTSEDEVPLASLVCKRYGANHIVRHLSAQEFFDDLPSILEAMDQPSIDGVNTWFVSKAAKEAGLKVVLSGLGGDEILGGYPSFSDLPSWHRRFGRLSAIPGLGLLARKFVLAVAPNFSRAMPKAPAILEYSSSWAGTYLLRRGLFLPHELPNVMDGELAREGLRRLDPLRRLGKHLEPDPKSDNGQVCVLESTRYMRDQLLRDADWAGMAHSLEIRVPLVDSVLLNTLSPVVPQLSPGAGKAALARVPASPLPNEIVARAKTGFSVPTGAWMDVAATGVTLSAPWNANRKGLISRRWSQVVLNGAPRPKVTYPPPQLCAS